MPVTFSGKRSQLRTLGLATYSLKGRHMVIHAKYFRGDVGVGVLARSWKSQMQVPVLIALQKRTQYWRVEGTRPSS